MDNKTMFVVCLVSLMILSNLVLLGLINYFNQPISCPTLKNQLNGIDKCYVNFYNPAIENKLNFTSSLSIPVYDIYYNDSGRRECDNLAWACNPSQNYTGFVCEYINASKECNCYAK